jgi:hypothetical protein
MERHVGINLLSNHTEETRLPNAVVGDCQSIGERHTYFIYLYFYYVLVMVNMHSIEGTVSNGKILILLLGSLHNFDIQFLVRI